jgi:hypothetical protein
LLEQDTLLAADANADGVLDADEIDALLSPYDKLIAADTNADGVLDADEIACMSPMSPMSPAPADTIEALRQQLRSQEKVLMDEKSKSGRYYRLLPTSVCHLPLCDLC